MRPTHWDLAMFLGKEFALFAVGLYSAMVVSYCFDADNPAQDWLRISVGVLYVGVLVVIFVAMPLLAVQFIRRVFR